MLYFFLVLLLLPLSSLQLSMPRYSIPDQPQRFANAQKDNNERYLNIDSVYDPKWLRGKTVAVTGANRGLGLELAKELSKLNCRVIGLCRGASEELSGLDGVEVVEKFDVTSIEAVEECCSKLAGSYLNKVDCLINNAGYFYGPEESIAADTINYEEELKMIDICALGPLRATSSFHKFGLLKKHPTRSQRSRSLRARAAPYRGATFRTPPGGTT